MNDTEFNIDISRGGLHVVMEGDPVNGFDVYGPFKTAADAISWAMEHCAQEWWPVPLKEPAK